MAGLGKIEGLERWSPAESNGETTGPVFTITGIALALACRSRKKAKMMPTRNMDEKGDMACTVKRSFLSLPAASVQSFPTEDNSKQSNRARQVQPLEELADMIKQQQI